MSAAECVLVNPGDPETSPPTVFFTAVYWRNSEDVLTKKSSDHLECLMFFMTFLNGIFSSVGATEMSDISDKTWTNKNQSSPLDVAGGLLKSVSAKLF